MRRPTLHPTTRLRPRLRLAAVLSLFVCAPAFASYTIEKIAVAGDAAPDVGGTQSNDFLSVAVNDADEVGFLNNVVGGSAAWAAFRGLPGALSVASAAGDAAPDTGGGSYFFPGGFVTLDAGGALTFAAVVSGGSAGAGIFSDDGGTETSRVVAGAAAPGTGGGAFAGSVGLLNVHAGNATGTVAFVDGVAGGSVAQGVFTSGSGGQAAVAVEGDTAPDSGGATYATFSMPSINAAGDVAFVATLSGGSATSGVFLHATGTPAVAVALQGDAAPGTGGATFSDFGFPIVNANGIVTFLANTTGGAATGGVFVFDGAQVVPLIVEGDPAPAVGGTFSGVTSFVPLSDSGIGAIAAIVTGGSAAAAIFRWEESTGALAPIVLAGDTAPDAGGATFAAFGFLDVNEDGDVAFQTELSTGDKGLFFAGAPASVPALDAGGVTALAAALASLGGLGARRPRATRR